MNSTAVNVTVISTFDEWFISSVMFVRNKSLWCNSSFLYNVQT